MALVASRFRNGLGWVKHVYDVVFKMRVKVTHKECFARQTVGVFKEVGKRKTWSQRICSFCWVEGGRYRTSWLLFPHERVLHVTVLM